MITPLDLSWLVKEFSSKTITLKRNTESYTSAGLRSVSSVTSTIDGSVQPITGEELKRLPEGFAEKTLWSVWTTSVLLRRDILTIDGLKYEVRHVDDWLGNGTYHKAICERLDAGELP